MSMKTILVVEILINSSQKSESSDKVEAMQIVAIFSMRRCFSNTTTSYGSCGCGKHGETAVDFVRSIAVKLWSWFQVKHNILGVTADVGVAFLWMILFGWINLNAWSWLNINPICFFYHLFFIWSIIRLNTTRIKKCRTF